MKKATTESKKWKTLYQAAAEFRAIEPWKWVKETDLFGVKDPVTGEIGYCCVMGEMGEVLAMAVYLGTGGFNGYRMIQDQNNTAEYGDFMFVQDCFLVSFENKSGLEKEDKALIKELGIEATGKRAWPMFRRHEPGYFPWFIEQKDLQYLTLVLQQAKEVCLRIKKNNGLPQPPRDGQYLVRVYDSTSGAWEDVWLKPAPPTHSAPAPAVFDELRLKRLIKIARPSSSVWEIDFFYAPTPIGKEGRPYFPYAMMIADSDTGLIQDVHLSDKKSYSAEFSDRLITCIEKSELLPGEILVRGDEPFEMLKSMASRLNIRLSRAKRLAAIDSARRSLENHLDGREASSPLFEGYCGDEQMEELLESAGSELSIYGLYGLIYGCIASQGMVMPSVLMPAIFGNDDLDIETEAQAEETIGNIFTLWNCLNEWDPEKEGIMLPAFEYPTDRYGIMHRCVEALELGSSFITGLELGGLSYGDMPDDLKEAAEQLRRTTDVLVAQTELIEQATNFRAKEAKEAVQAIKKAEFIIGGCIAEIYQWSKEAGPHLPSVIKNHNPQVRGLPVLTGSKVGRNELCPCGSGKKFKKCCGMSL
ncbi:MAG: YecA/YgfB family protein [Thermodesulfovibrionales bacterium]